MTAGKWSMLCVIFLSDLSSYHHGVPSAVRKAFGPVKTDQVDQLLFSFPLVKSDELINSYLKIVMLSNQKPLFVVLGFF